MMTGPAKRAEAGILRRKQSHKEENTRPTRKLVQGRSIWRSLSRSPLLAGGRIGNAIRPPCSARTEGALPSGGPSAGRALWSDAMATFDFTITEAGIGEMIGPPDGFLVNLTMVTPPVHETPR